MLDHFVELNRDPIARNRVPSATFIGCHDLCTAYPQSRSCKSPKAGGKQLRKSTNSRFPRRPNPGTNVLDFCAGSGLCVSLGGGGRGSGPCAESLVKHLPSDQMRVGRPFLSGMLAPFALPIEPPPEPPSEQVSATEAIRDLPFHDPKKFLLNFLGDRASLALAHRDPVDRTDRRDLHRGAARRTFHRRCTASRAGSALRQFQSPSTARVVTTVSRVMPGSTLAPSGGVSILPSRITKIFSPDPSLT